MSEETGYVFSGIIVTVVAYAILFVDLKISRDMRKRRTPIYSAIPSYFIVDIVEIVLMLTAVMLFVLAGILDTTSWRLDLFVVAIGIFVHIAQNLWAIYARIQKKV